MNVEEIMKTRSFTFAEKTQLRIDNFTGQDFKNQLINSYTDGLNDMIEEIKSKIFLESRSSENDVRPGLIKAEAIILEIEKDFLIVLKSH